MFGYAGRTLHIDLERGKSLVKPLDEGFCRQYVGGNGFAIRLLYSDSRPKIDPLSPENPLIFAVGPFAGTMVPTAGKYIVQAKSPLTNFMGEAVSSGFWAHSLKQAGYDAVLIRGRAEKPVYLFIDDDVVQFVEAGRLWGTDTMETMDRIKEEVGDENIGVASIGPGGENLVRFANIANDRHRQAGRTGMGAVMGSKNLKAVAVRGTKGVKVSDLEGLMEACKEVYEACQGPLTEGYRHSGTPASLLLHQAIAALPTRNWQDAVFDLAESIGDKYVGERWVVKAIACAGCPIACDHITVVKEESGKILGSVEFESLYALGSQCGVGDFPAINRAVDLCDRMGIDTISTGVTIGWAMECYERGLLTDKDTGGLELAFGNSEALLEAIRKIAYQEGVGKILAQGVKRASEVIGRGSERFAMHNKGLEYPGYDLRGLKASVLGFNTSTRGGCHLRSSMYDFDLKGKVDRFTAKEEYGKLVRDREDMWSVVDSLMLCKFIRSILSNYGIMAKLYTLTTGLEMTEEELRRAGERIYNLEKAYNVREGWKREDDYPAPRIMSDPIKSGVARGSVITREEFDLLFNAYCRERGWTPDGVPTKRKLLELGLEDEAEEVGASEEG
jgi:aldehyde:ferredoxin oxidoreductase